VASGILALGDDGVGTSGDGERDLIGCLDLADQQCTTGVDGVGIRPGVTEGELDRRRVCVKGEAQRVRALVERERDDADTDSCIAGRRELGGQPLRTGVTASDETEAAGLGDRGCQPAAGGVTHRRQHDRMPDTEQRGERRRDGDRARW